MKTFEIFKNDTKKSRLTVTPTRITIKLDKTLSDDKQQNLIDFGYSVAKELEGLPNSWRGCFNERGIYMNNGHGNNIFFTNNNN
jgi:hypothetical protein